jgi:hypothetical protein
MTTNTIEHLAYEHFHDNIALCLDEDVYGANGNLDRWQILERLVENIHAATNYQFKETGLIPERSVASLILHVWQYMDRKYMEEIGRATPEWAK